MKGQAILITIVLIAFVSCKGVKNKSTNDTSADTQTMANQASSIEKTSKENTSMTRNVLAANRGTTGADSDLTYPASGKTTNQNINKTIEGTSTTSGNIVNQSSGSTGAASNTMMTVSDNTNDETSNFEKMYTDLKMTEIQIEQFKTAMRNYRPSEGSDIEEEQDKKLESILSEAQYEDYMKWRKNNH